VQLTLELLKFFFLEIKKKTKQTRFNIKFLNISKLNIANTRIRLYYAYI